MVKTNFPFLTSARKKSHNKLGSLHFHYIKFAIHIWDNVKSFHLFPFISLNLEMFEILLDFARFCLPFLSTLAASTFSGNDEIFLFFDNQQKLNWNYNIDILLCKQNTHAHNCEKNSHFNQIVPFKLMTWVKHLYLLWHKLPCTYFLSKYWLYLLLLFLGGTLKDLSIESINIKWHTGNIRYNNNVIHFLLDFDSSPTVFRLFLLLSLPF